MEQAVDAPSQTSAPDVRVAQQRSRKLRGAPMVELPTIDSISTVSSRQATGCGNHGDAPLPNPNGGPSPPHGIGTRHPSGPRIRWPDHAHEPSVAVDDQHPSVRRLHARHLAVRGAHRGVGVAGASTAR
jgi:hypothetical protein